MDRFTSVLLVAGLGCFALAFVLSGLYPWLITDAKQAEATIAEVAYNVTTEFKQMKEMYPVAFTDAYPTADECLTDRDLASADDDDPRRAKSDDAWRAAHAFALQAGRDTYVAEACWHCHSQFVRPVANETQRFGRIRNSADENNALQRPMMFGTRRVGPDLTNEGGKRSNDWHVAHFSDPTGTSPGSIMPAYTWFFRDGHQVFRTIDPESAERTGIATSRRYPVPGVYATQADAEAALQRASEATPDNLSAERERLLVGASEGPTPNALNVIAYLQWLGTWTDDDRREPQQ